MAPAVALRRRAFALLRDKVAVSVLFDKIGPMMKDRNGGYTRIVRLARVRQNDASPLAIIEFVGTIAIVRSSGPLRWLSRLRTDD